MSSSLAASNSNSTSESSSRDFSSLPDNTRPRSGAVSSTQSPSSPSISPSPMSSSTLSSSSSSSSEDRPLSLGSSTSSSQSPSSSSSITIRQRARTISHSSQNSSRRNSLVVPSSDYDDSSHSTSSSSSPPSVVSMLSSSSLSSSSINPLLPSPSPPLHSHHRRRSSLSSPSSLSKGSDGFDKMISKLSQNGFRPSPSPTRGERRSVVKNISNFNSTVNAMDNENNNNQTANSTLTSSTLASSSPSLSPSSLPLPSPSPRPRSLSHSLHHLSSSRPLLIFLKRHSDSIRLILSSIIFFQFITIPIGVAFPKNFDISSPLTEKIYHFLSVYGEFTFVILVFLTEWIPFYREFSKKKSTFSSSSKTSNTITTSTSSLSSKTPSILTDILISLPFHFIFHTLLHSNITPILWSNPSLSTPTQLYSLYQIPKLYRLRRFYRNLDSFEAKNLVSTYFDPKVIRILKLLLSIFMLSHIVGMGYMFISEIERGENPMVNHQNPHDQNEWMVPWSIRSQPFIAIYLHCLSVGITAMTGNQLMGTPSTILENIFHLVVTLLGISIYAVVLSNFSQIIQTLNANAEEFRERMTNIIQLMQTYNIPNDVQLRVRKCVQIIYRVGEEEEEGEGQEEGEGEAEREGEGQRKDPTDPSSSTPTSTPGGRGRGIAFGSSLWNDLDILPGYLKNELLVAINGSIISTVPIFKNCSDGFVRSLVPLLKPECVIPGDYIIRSGEIGREMFLLRHGQMAVEALGEVVATVTDGAYLGEIALFFEQKRTASVRAITVCDILILSKDAFSSVLSQYPEVAKSMRMQALMRKNARTMQEKEKKEKEKDKDKENTSATSNTSTSNVGKYHTMKNLAGRGRGETVKTGEGQGSGIAEKNDNSAATTNNNNNNNPAPVIVTECANVNTANSNSPHVNESRGKENVPIITETNSIEKSSVHVDEEDTNSSRSIMHNNKKEVDNGMRNTPKPDKGKDKDPSTTNHIIQSMNIHFYRQRQSKNDESPDHDGGEPFIIHPTISISPPLPPSSPSSSSSPSPLPMSSSNASDSGTEAPTLHQSMTFPSLNALSTLSSSSSSSTSSLGVPSSLLLPQKSKWHKLRLLTRASHSISGNIGKGGGAGNGGNGENGNRQSVESDGGRK